MPDRGPRADREAAGGGTLGGSLWADPEAAGGAPGRGPRPRPDGMPSVLGPQQAPEHWHDDRRRPVQLRTRRTAGDVLAGLGALLALVGLVGGVPYALLRLAGPPITGDLLNADLFTSQVGPETITAILILLVWLAWLQLFLCVVVEVYAALRRVGMPARVPLSGGTQALANRLVSAVLLLFTATAVAVPIARAGAPAAIRPDVAALSAPVPQAEAERPALHAREVKKVYVVQPPHGRHHESLWEIAEKCLGDGRRYPEIYRLNQHKEQPDGSRLHMADLIRPGWVLDMPDDARNVHIVPVDDDRPEILKEHRQAPAELDGDTRYAKGGATGGDVHADPRTTVDRRATEDRHTTPHPRPTTGSHTGSDTAGATEGERDTTRPDNAGDQGDTGHVGGRATPEPSKPGIVLPPPAMPQDKPSEPKGRTGDAKDTPATARPTPTPRPIITTTVKPAVAPAEEEPQGGPVLADYLAASSLAAAGLLALLGRRRREQLWHRAFGRRITRPRGDAAEAEVAIRLGADAPGSRMLDIGLRLLGRLLADADRRPPTIYAVHLSNRGLDLWIHPAEQDAPEPWETCDDGQVWRLPAHEGRRIDEHVLAGVPAPYPGLVSLGTGQGGRVLVDLEAAHGVIAITGAHTVAALSALAVELATNRWSDRMRITLVGFGEELTLLAPDRIRTAGSLAEVLPEFEERARHDGDVLTGRVHSRVDDPAYTPHYLLSAIRPDEDEARRLALLGKGRRTASGFVIAGELPHATWTWEVTDDGRARVDALGLDIEAHLLPRRHYDAVIGLFRTARQQEGEPLTPVMERLSEEPPSIEVRILGPIEISPVNPLEEGRAALAHELVVYLATHPDGVHPAVLTGVLWPRGVQLAVRDATIARVAEWLGRDSEGRPHLFLDRSGRLRLGPEVRTDWRLFQDLVRQAGEWADAADPTNAESGGASGGTAGGMEADLLERALALVRGPLLNGRPPDRYAWLAADPLEYDVTAWVADAAHALCEIRLARHDPHGAVAAARAGLLLAADDEGLWRDLLRAAHATGEPVRLRAVVDGLLRRATSHPYGGGMAPETEALIDELLPDWRRTVSPDLRNPARRSPALGNPALGNPALGKPALGKPGPGSPADLRTSRLA
ncbi:bacterial transcriptional activator domain-containing protein [Microbispora hainanensis]|uniref:Bacterial transcriptional activator domain-containing protein n=1 Tax=Microbispora hainanensis TaxID=568844 RepID=A0ABZ1SG87_9ACTN|nr:bacterial transcriptional activator domain-containing protein [Microbispora hainanensis]